MSGTLTPNTKMSGNPKARLLEAHQAVGAPLPTFTCLRAGGPDHAPHWVAVVRFEDGTELRSRPHVSKSGAERAAATDALEALSVGSVMMANHWGYGSVPASAGRAQVRAVPAKIPTSPTAVPPARQAPVVARREPTVVQREPTVAWRGPTVARREPTVARREPTVAWREPSAARQKLTVARREPSPAAPPGLVHIIIDVENMCGPAQRLLERIQHVPLPRQFRVKFCMSRNCQLVDKFLRAVAGAPCADCCVTSCRESNAADVLICLQAAGGAAGSRVVLLSNDRLIHTLANVCRELYPDRSVVAIGSERELEEMIELR